MENTESKTLMNKRETNWFRGIAAIMVVLSHYGHWFNIIASFEGNAETFRLALTKLGVYGVDIFFLFSGYAMIKSLGNRKMNWQFIRKRIKNVYIPYLLITGIIELISGGLTSAHDFWRLVSGYDYWYMCVLFIFNIGFIIIYSIIRIKGIRVIAFSVFTYVLSYELYLHEMSDFWYVSNIAFAIGIIVGEYEELTKMIVGKIWLPMLATLTLGMIFVTRLGLAGGVDLGGDSEDYQLLFKVGATVVWTLLILILSAKCRIKDKTLAFLGRNSLYIYLTHIYVFMQFINMPMWDLSVKFAISPICIIVVSFLCSLIISGMWKFISMLGRRLKLQRTK